MSIQLSQVGIGVEYKRSQVQSPLKVIFFAEFIYLFPTQAFITNIANFL